MSFIPFQSFFLLMKFHALNFNNAALIVAVEKGNIDIVELLLTREDIDINMKKIVFYFVLFMTFEIRIFIIFTNMIVFDIPFVFLIQFQSQNFDSIPNHIVHYIQKLQFKCNSNIDF